MCLKNLGRFRQKLINDRSRIKIQMSAYMDLRVFLWHGDIQMDNSAEDVP